MDVEAEEVITEGYDSSNDLRQIWNHPYIVLDQDEYGKEIPSRRTSITATKFTEDKKIGRVLFVGTEEGSIEIWSLERLQRLLRVQPKSKRAAISSFAITNESTTGSLLITFGPLDKTRNDILGLPQTISDIKLFTVKFSVDESPSLLYTGYSRSLRSSRDDKKAKSSRVMFSSMLERIGGPAEKCLFIWEIPSRKSSEVCMELLNSDQMIELKQSEEEKKRWYTKFDVQTSGSIVSATLLPNSVEDFELKTQGDVVTELYKNPPTKTFRNSHSVSFDILVGARGSIKTFSFAGAQQQRLNYIATNIRELLSSSTRLREELLQCKAVSLIQTTTDDYLFNLFDLLLQQNLLTTLCKHIAIASRLEPITEWVIQKCEQLQHHRIFEFIAKGKIDVSSSVQQANALAMAINSLIVLINALFMEHSRFDAASKHYTKLQEIFALLQQNSQFLELWNWFTRHELFFLAFGPGKPPESTTNINLLCEVAKVNSSYPPKNPRELLCDVWGQLNPTMDAQLLVNKLQVIYYFLLDASVKSSGGGIANNKLILDSFAFTFAQVLTVPIQKQVHGYWLLDNIQMSHSLSANASKYLSFENQCVSLIDVAYSSLSYPGVSLEWPSTIFQQFVAIDEAYAARFLQHADFSLAVDDHRPMLDLLLPKNLFLSLQFVRTQCKSTLDVDSQHLADLLNYIFEYCRIDNCIESLFLLSFTRDEEALLFQYLSEHYQDADPRVLYYLQRSQFVKAVDLSENSEVSERCSHLVNNYKSVLPHAMFSAPRPKDITSMDIEKSGDIQMQEPSSPQRLSSFLRTPKTEKIHSKIVQHRAFPAPTLAQNNNRSVQPFTPHVVPNTPASRIRMVHGSAKFAPFQRSSARRTPRQSTSMATPKVIPFSVE